MYLGDTDNWELDHKSPTPEVLDRALFFAKDNGMDMSPCATLSELRLRLSTFARKRGFKDDELRLEEDDTFTTEDGELMRLERRGGEKVLVKVPHPPKPLPGGESAEWDRGMGWGWVERFRSTALST